MFSSPLGISCLKLPVTVIKTYPLTPANTRRSAINYFGCVQAFYLINVLQNMLYWADIIYILFH